MDMFWHYRSQFYQYEWGKAREIEPLHVHVRVTPQVSELYLGAIISAWDATRLGHNSTVQTQAWGSYSYCIINVLLLFFLFSQVSSSFFSRWLSFCISLQLILLYNIKDLWSWLLLSCFVAEQNHDAPPDRQTGCTRFGEEVSQGKRHKLHVITDHLYIYIVDKKIDIKSSLYSWWICRDLYLPDTSMTKNTSLHT